ncbi:hypothetical protein [uncultured Cellulomonas sp.]|uniref:hypothetical protein n=1 Tax=uncultured Cellulomonas sp. TaxID=189682 RepID=UPI0028E6695C|nr:hypothetical protein [uncultured Cellulomonas sp.]
MVRRPPRSLGLAALAALALCGCTSEPPRPSSAISPTPTPSASVTSAAPTPTPTPSPSLVPGAPCDPADGSPDCTDATGAGDGRWVYLEGYADCVAQLPGEEYGLCTDLDGDGRAGYPDSG